jgi:hypothetical protein
LILKLIFFSDIEIFWNEHIPFLKKIAFMLYFVSWAIIKNAAKCQGGRWQRLSSRGACPADNVLDPIQRVFDGVRSQDEEKERSKNLDILVFLGSYT